MDPGQGQTCTCTCTCNHCDAPKNGDDVCWKTRKGRRDFAHGQILHVPLHASNMDPGLKWGHPCLKMSSSNAGPVHSKCRFVVVFRKFHKQMECLPIYTHGGNGVESKHNENLDEWIPVENMSEKKPPNKNTSPSLFVSLENEPVRQNSYVHVTESVMVECADWIEIKGMMEEPSFGLLHEQRAKFNSAARKEAFDEYCQQRGKQSRRWQS